MKILQIFLIIVFSYFLQSNSLVSIDAQLGKIDSLTDYNKALVLKKLHRDKEALELLKKTPRD